ncbi:D-lactaldehyde dehydrogenase [Punctularia strigosozonata HHB-11173 SS5]|uniref:D-lactaldehyde dehydrogenase n=1 Tax=Punctularia strigosozonata (strain HHB-11173) TaxID=741275 RepID=UPI00044171E9|nr:D-lactaldehyde dehydrogenase [Punctularia strigosozonata HHB-11173 SS5]EIN05399.1 D-lactaldehyde dehydrogenase [Punctularia strigosozonata HHB-11173 SS5]
MPAVQPGSKVLVTGANGYIAVWVVRNLLEHGYFVRGTVRSEAKAEYLKTLFEDKYADKYEFVIVDDITKEGAFDTAVQGVDAVEHTASPFNTHFEDPEDFIIPAVKGTTSVIESVLKHGKDVKRIVVTSSCAAVLHQDPNPITYSEKDWNEQAAKEVEEKGRDAAAMQKYRASKTLAEKAAWDLYNKNKSSVGWDLVVLNPPYVFGPVIHDVSSPSSLNTSMLDWYDTVVKGTKDENTLATSGSCWIDVRDLAEAHRLAIEKEAAGGERIIVSGGHFKWQDWVDAANSITPPIYDKLPKGKPGAGKGLDVVHLIKYDVSKANRILGLEYRSIETATKDTLEDFKARGW